MPGTQFMFQLAFVGNITTETQHSPNSYLESFHSLSPLSQWYVIILTIYPRTPHTCACSLSPSVNSSHAEAMTVLYHCKHPRVGHRNAPHSPGLLLFLLWNPCFILQTYGLWNQPGIRCDLSILSLQCCDSTQLWDTVGVSFHDHWSLGFPDVSFAVAHYLF